MSVGSEVEREVAAGRFLGRMNITHSPVCFVVTAPTTREVSRYLRGQLACLVPAVVGHYERPQAGKPSRARYGSVDGLYSSVVTHPCREPPLDRRDSALAIDWMNGSAGARHWRGGHIFIAVDEEGIGLPTADRAHSAAGLVVGSVNGCSICFTLHIDAPNRGIRGHCSGDDDDGGDGAPTFEAHVGATGSKM
jgi:hypothetical protein